MDLDAAYSNGENYELINHLISNIKVDVQLSGGIANQVSLEKALASFVRWALMVWSWAKRYISVLLT